MNQRDIDEASVRAGDESRVGLRTVPSEFSPKDTMDRLEAEVRAIGMTVFLRFDHAAGAISFGLPLRPTELLIFGHARSGTPFMQADQASGIDLPLKALVYQDGSGKAWVAYNDPAWIAARHGIGDAVVPNVSAMTAALQVVVAKATSP